mgnify:FL=1
MRRGVVVAWMLLALALAPPCAGAASGDVPKPGRVTLVDLGSGACVPCKMMQPVLEAVTRRYDGRAAVVFIDIRKEPDAAKAYGIRLIPTQVFFGRDGKEAWRHEGYLDEPGIAAVLDRLLAE